MVAMNDDHVSGRFSMDDCSPFLKREVPKAILIIYHIYIKDPNDLHMRPSQKWTSNVDGNQTSDQVDPADGLIRLVRPPIPHTPPGSTKRQQKSRDINQTKLFDEALMLESR
jgi:hypothetical protein